MAISTLYKQAGGQNVDFFSKKIAPSLTGCAMVINTMCYRLNFFLTCFFNRSPKTSLWLEKSPSISSAGCCGMKQRLKKWCLTWLPITLIIVVCSTRQTPGRGYRYWARFASLFRRIWRQRRSAPLRRNTKSRSRPACSRFGAIS